MEELLQEELPLEELPLEEFLLDELLRRMFGGGLLLALLIRLLLVGMLRGSASREGPFEGQRFPQFGAGADHKANLHFDAGRNPQFSV